MSSLQRRWLLILLLLVTYAIAYDGDINGNLDIFHEGDRLAHMDKLWSGGLPFRDIYVQQGLGENILKPALACKLWGPSIASLRRLGENSYIYRGYLPPLGLVATLIAVFALTQSLLLTVLSAAFLLSGWYEITERHALGMLAVACGGCYLQCRGQYWLVLSGLLSALAAIYSLEVGLYCSTAIFMWLVIDVILRRHPQAKTSHSIGAFVAGMSFPLAVLIAWCTYKGITRDFCHNIYCQLFMRSVVAPAVYPVPDMSAGFGNLIQRLILYYLLLFTIFLAIIISAIKMRTFYTARLSALLLTGLLGLAFWASVWGRPDLWHVAYAVGPFVVFAAALVSALPEVTTSLYKRVAFVSPAIVCLVALLAIGSGGAVGRWFGYSSSYLPPNLSEPQRDLVACDIPRLGGVRIGRVQAGFTRSIVDYIHQHSRRDETILDLSDFPLIYFLAERLSPTRFHLISHVGRSTLRGEMAREVQVQMPALIIRRDEPLQQGDVLDELVARYYVRDASIGTLELWLRK